MSSALSELEDFIFLFCLTKWKVKQTETVIERPNLVACLVPWSEILRIKIMSLFNGNSCSFLLFLFLKKKHENLIIKNVFFVFFPSLLSSCSSRNDKESHGWILSWLFPSFSCQYSTFELFTLLLSLTVS